jgi:hypothetical protein
MKHCILFLSTAAISSLFTGCVYQTTATFEKKIEVHRDSTGKITQTIETETITQPGLIFGREGVQPEHLRYKKDSTDVVSVSH